MSNGLADSTTELLERIFYDARVLDVDFSEWDRGIRLYVVGADAEWPLPERLPTFMVAFKKVAHFACAFKHLGIELDDPSWYFQWNLDGIKIARVANMTEVELSASGNSATIYVTCEDVVAQRFDPSVLDELFPGWEAPYSPLARPGIEAMYRAKRKRKASTD